MNNKRDNLIYIFCTNTGTFELQYLSNELRSVGFSGLISHIGSNTNTIILNLNNLSITFKNSLVNQITNISCQNKYVMTTHSYNPTGYVKYNINIIRNILTKHKLTLLLKHNEIIR